MIGKDFYSFFDTELANEVIYHNNIIGLLDLTPLIKYNKG